MEEQPLPDFPFSILAIAPFSPKAAITTTPLVVDPLDIDQALTTLAPSFFLSLPTRYCPAGGIQLCISKMRDFTPDGLLQSQPFLQDLLEADRNCQKAAQEGASPAQITAGLQQYPNLPSLHLKEKKAHNTETTSALDNILSMIDLPDNPSATRQNTSSEPNSYNSVAEAILEIIYTDPLFRSLESCWQGLRFLGRSLGRAEGKLAILPAAPDAVDELLAGIREYVIASPPSLLLVDHSFSSSEVSVHLMEQLAEFGQEMFVPVAAAADASFFHIDQWHELETLSFLPHHLEGPSFARINGFRQSAAARWLSLSCFRFLLRFPYGPENRSRTLPFHEKEILWISPVWAISTLLAIRNAQCGWAAGLSSPHSPLLEDLALYPEGSVNQKPIESIFEKDRLEQMERCGLMPLAAWKGKDTAFVAADVMVSADCSLSYQLLVCRVSHWILWCRDHWQGDFGPQELTQRLRTAFLQFADSEDMTSAGELQVQCDREGRDIQVSFSWTPSRQILAATQEISLNFTW